MKTFYEKRGRRYFPVSQYDSGLMDALPRGSHLITVEPGCRSTIYHVKPDEAAIVAALETKRDAIMQAIREATAARPQMLTARERKALKAWQAVAGPDALFTLTIPGAQAIVDALRNAIAPARGNGEGEK